MKKIRVFVYSLFIYQDENKDENQSFRSFLYVLKQTCDERTINASNVILRAWFGLFVTGIILNEQKLLFLVLFSSWSCAC